MHTGPRCSCFRCQLWGVNDRPNLKPPARVRHDKLNLSRAEQRLQTLRWWFSTAGPPTAKSSRLTLLVLILCKGNTGLTFETLCSHVRASGIGNTSTVALITKNVTRPLSTLSCNNITHRG
ncbi:unnamed protein product [Ectocarpus sp. 8 AP-2014]